MKPLSRYILALSVSFLLVAPKKIAQGCGFYMWPGEYRFWMLQPDLTNQKELSPFYLATSYLYPHTYQSMDNRHYGPNIEEWRTLTANKVKAADIDTILYHTGTGEFLEQLDSLVRINSFAAFLAKPGNRDYLQYMQLSKKAEAIAENPDPWQEGIYPNPVIDRTIKQANALYNATQNTTIRLRTAYQLMRLHAYNQQRNYIDTIWKEKVERVHSASWIKTAAMYIKALHTPSPQSDYLFSKAFDRGDYNRGHCLINFRSSQLDKALLLATNKHERTVLYAMKAFTYPGKALNDLEKIYRMEPGYKEINFLLLREINKVEDWLLTPAVTGFGPALYDYEISLEGPGAANYKRDKAYAAALYDFIKKMIAENKNSNKALLYLCAAHLAFVQGYYAASRNYLTRAAAFPHLPANLKTQLLVSDVLVNLATEPGWSKAAEVKFMRLLNSSAEELGVHDPAIMKDQLILYAGRQLMRKGDRARGLLLLGKTRRALGTLSISTLKRVYEVIWEKATAADYDSMVSILTRQHPAAFEKFVSAGVLKDVWDNDEEYEDESNPDAEGWDINRLKEGKAGYYIREDSLEKAWEVLKQLPDSLWRQYPYDPYGKGDPFLVNINHPHSVDTTEKTYSKPQLIAQMIKLKQQAQREPEKAALCYFRLANAYYNFTYHGKHWIISKPWWSTGDGDEYHLKNVVPGFNGNYYGCERAKQYYLKALKATKDKKLASLCCMMAGICQENYRNYLLDIDEWNGVDKFANPYIKLLKQKKMGTDYYREIIEECATYNSYVKQLNN
ncbi:hypothetical protein HB364_32505 [Pseudoflavitalea sp. X16]|uniref:hypothetical protein n=1 Tax=Paraflavitalea devenefica TaxID=2716334 RepID=UPI0014222EE7|nr:hypothetical protein [Paraflavitalea devenefica]NII29845.1 hypothetical protein [Paraflavitalea devenefica]